MQPKHYFQKTFVFTFMFYIVYKSTVQLIDDFQGFNFKFMFKTLIIGLIVAAILGGINYFAKVDFPPQKRERKSGKNNN